MAVAISAKNPKNQKIVVQAIKALKTLDFGKFFQIFESVGNTKIYDLEKGATDPHANLIIEIFNGRAHGELADYDSFLTQDHAWLVLTALHEIKDASVSSKLAFLFSMGPLLDRTAIMSAYAPEGAFKIVPAREGSLGIRPGDECLDKTFFFPLVFTHKDLINRKINLDVMSLMIDYARPLGYGDHYLGRALQLHAWEENRLDNFVAKRIAQDAVVPAGKLSKGRDVLIRTATIKMGRDDFDSESKILSEMWGSFLTKDVQTFTYLAGLVKKFWSVPPGKDDDFSEMLKYVQNPKKKLSVEQQEMAPIVIALSSMKGLDYYSILKFSEDDIERDDSPKLT